MQPQDAAPQGPSAATRRDLPLLALLALTVAVVVGYCLDLGTTSAQVVVSWLLMAVTNLSFAVTSAKVARLPGYTPSARRLWYMCSFAGIMYLLGDLVQFVPVLRDPLTQESIVGTSVQSALVVVGTSAIIVGMLIGQFGNTAAGQRTSLRLDIATVMAAATAVGLYAFEVPPGAHTIGWVFDLLVQLMVAPGVFLVATFAVVKLILGGRPPFTRSAGLIGGGAAVIQGFLQSIPPAEYATSRALPLLLGGNAIASILLAIGARIQWRGGLAARQEGRERRLYSVLPYAAIAGTNMMLVYVLAAGGLTGRTWTVIVGSIVGTSLVVARQLAAFRHIAELLRERDTLTTRLTELAFHDGLTGLANRELFMRRLAEAQLVDAAASAADRGAELAVVLVDLDDFKPVNDQHGHAAGDELLRRVGGWLTETVRAGDTVARLGGDEFALLVTGLRPDEREDLAKRVRTALHRTTRIGEVDVLARGSVGVAFARPGARTPEELLNAADLDMYDAKRRTKALAAAR